MRVHKNSSETERHPRITLCGAHSPTGNRSSKFVSIGIANGRIEQILTGAEAVPPPHRGIAEIDLSGYWVLPGLVNAHDHLEFALYPKLADGPYRNYIEWGEDIQRKFPEVIQRQHSVPRRVRLLWGGLRNLLCGVTTVAHHNPLWPELIEENFPVRVVKEFGWAHSIAQGGDLSAAFERTPIGDPFMVHACEGVDELARSELWELDRLGLLGPSTILIHGLAIDRAGVRHLRERGCSLVFCPSSNYFLFGRVPDLELLSSIQRVALGSDSPLTASGHFVDEIGVAISQCGVSPVDAYRMVTTGPAEILRLADGEGSLIESGVADLIAVRDTIGNPIEHLEAISIDEIELVMIGGQVQLASEAMQKRLPDWMIRNLEPLLLGSLLRWVNAPVAEMLESAEAVLGAGQIRIGDRVAHTPAFAEAQHAV
jgi:cytosine/adenosine deaminase-related metal-dependent hydrolase